MSSSKYYHTALGVYDIYSPAPDKLLVIHKTQGPYAHRYDLPGGSFEPQEGLSDTLMREWEEETGLNVTHFKQLGVATFRYPWNFEQFNYNKHIAILNEVSQVSGTITTQVRQFEDQDSFGAVFVSLGKLNKMNSSPLVLKAKEYLESGVFTATDEQWLNWQVLEER